MRTDPTKHTSDETSHLWKYTPTLGNLWRHISHFVLTRFWAQWNAAIL